MASIESLQAAAENRRIARRYVPGTLVCSLRPGLIHRAVVESISTVDGMLVAVVSGNPYPCSDLVAIRPPMPRKA